MQRCRGWPGITLCQCVRCGVLWFVASGCRRTGGARATDLRRPSTFIRQGRDVRRNWSVMTAAEPSARLAASGQGSGRPSSAAQSGTGQSGRTGQDRTAAGVQPVTDSRSAQQDEHQRSQQPTDSATRIPAGCPVSDSRQQLSGRDGCLLKSSLHRTGWIYDGYMDVS